MDEQIRKNTMLMSLLAPGDHIASERKLELYEHHGFFFQTLNTIFFVWLLIVSVRLNCLDSLAVYCYAKTSLI